MSTERTVTRREAAALCRSSYDTIRRRQTDGAYPNASDEPDGIWRIPVSDLVAAGDLDPTGPNAAPAVGPTGDVSDAQLRIAVLETALERTESENEYFRSLVLQLTASIAAVA